VPQSLDDETAAFAWLVGCAVHAAQLVKAERPQYVTVLGDSVEGLLTAQAIAHHNTRVRVLGTRPDRLALCEKWSGGLKHRPLADAGRRRDQDAVIDCTGTAESLSTALQLVRPRGTIVLPRPPGPADLSPVVEHEVTLIGSRAGSLAQALSMLARAEIDVASLIGRRFRLADAAAAFAVAADPGALRPLVDV
jgi:threonine dehydrogenase-like Zn-dependent dehydrogenase